LASSSISSEVQWRTGASSAGWPLSHDRQQQEAIRIYHEQQNIEYAALQEALDSSKWQDAIAVQFDTSDDPSARFTHRHRLIWDVFSPFYNCPSQQRVGTPRKLFDGGKWICGVQQLLQLWELLSAAWQSLLVTVTCQNTML
jgi:hypothetical protein